MTHQHFRRGTIWGVILTGVVLAGLIMWAHAGEVILSWINPSWTDSATEIIVGPTGEAYSAPCGPGDTCQTVVDLPSGDTETFIFQCNEDGCSEQSNVETYTAAAPEGCAWDSDGSGTVTVADFGAFLARFQAGEVNAADFGAFLRVFGKPCA